MSTIRLSNCKFRDYEKYICLNDLHCRLGRVKECAFFVPTDGPAPEVSTELKKAGLIMTPEWEATLLKSRGCQS